MHAIKIMSCIAYFIFKKFYFINNANKETYFFPSLLSIVSKLLKNKGLFCSKNRVLTTKEDLARSHSKACELSNLWKSVSSFLPQ